MTLLEKAKELGYSKNYIKNCCPEDIDLEPIITCPDIPCWDCWQREYKEGS